MPSIDTFAPSAPVVPPPAAPTGSRRRALLGTVLTTFPETLAEVLRGAGPELPATPSRRAWPERRPRGPGPIAGRPIDEAIATPAPAVPLEVQIEADVEAGDDETDAPPPRVRSIEVDPCGRVRVLSDFVAHVSPGAALRPLWGNLYPAGEPPESAQAGMSALLHAAANLTRGDLGQAARIVLAVTDDPVLYAALRGTYQAVLIDEDGQLVEHSLRRRASTAS